MTNRRSLCFGMLTALWMLIVVLGGAVPTRTTSATENSAQINAASPERQAAFATAAREFGVPENVLLAVSYNLSRWEHHAGAPSFDAGYGPMHLTHLDVAKDQHGKADAPARDTRHIASLHTLDAAAALLKLAPHQLRVDPTHNIRGGAALLAQYAREVNGALPTTVADWYTAVMRYSHAPNLRLAARFADRVYATMAAGAARTTIDGQSIILVATPVVPNKPAAIAAITPAQTPAVECPAELMAQCEFIPAAYEQNDPQDPSNYGNYDLANREADGLDIRYIVIHDTEGEYEGVIQAFSDPTFYASAHYLIRSDDGHIAQMVENKNVAWHAGNWYFNGHSIGLEHEGFAIEGATWYSENMYQASAALVRYLAAKYDIPLDRAHIIGHDEIPGPISSFQAGMHWDPGPFWDWTHYMELIGAPAGSDTRLVTLRISPRVNPQPVKDCEGNGAIFTRGVNFVYLHTAPDPNAPYITNPYISAHPMCANNWGNKALSGQTFYRFDTSVPDWDGIYFSGRKAWFYNPGHTRYTVPGAGKLIQPKGDTAISVYGRAYPEASAYPEGITPQAVVTLDHYTIPAGQIYAAVGPFKSAYYYAPVYTPTLEDSTHQPILGATEYYQVFYNHRFVFVRADEVTALPGMSRVYLPLVRNR